MKRLLIALGASLAALPVLAADYDFVGVPRLPGAPETVRREEHRRIHRTEEIEEHIRTEKVRPGVPTIPQPPVGVGYAPIGFPVGTPPLPCRRAVVTGLNTFPVIELLNLRAGPGVEYPPTERFGNGTPIQVCARSGPWLAVVEPMCAVDTANWVDAPCRKGWSFQSWILPVE
jgi:hypothetical protein